jgi:uncharacterized membrane protein YhhN
MGRAVIPMTLLCAVAVAALMLGEYLDNNRMRYTAKPLASLAFIAVGALALSGNSTISEFELAILAGLILGAIGDMALLSEQGFLAGLVAFLFGHLAYVAAVGTQLPPHMWLGAAGVYALAPVVVGLGALAYLWPKLGKLRVPVMFYVAVIIAMVISAIAMLRGNPGAVMRNELLEIQLHRRELFATGAVLFFISDLAVARDKFVAKSYVNRMWGLPIYYGAQLVIAWSLKQ